MPPKRTYEKRTQRKYIVIYIYLSWIKDSLVHSRFCFVCFGFLFCLSWFCLLSPFPHLLLTFDQSGLILLGLVKLVSRPVMIGFVNGLALVFTIGQVKQFRTEGMVYLQVFDSFK